MQTPRKVSIGTIVLDGKIYLIRQYTEEDQLSDVLDTVTGRWDSIPSPDLEGRRLFGYGVKRGKICFWTDEKELRFNPVKKTWKVFEKCRV